MLSYVDSWTVIYCKCDLCQGAPLPPMYSYKTIPIQVLRAPEGRGSYNFQTIGTWRWQDCQPYVPATFTPQEIFLVLIYVKFQWHWESNPRPSAWYRSFSTNCATACLMLIKAGTKLCDKLEYSCSSDKEFFSANSLTDWQMSEIWLL